MSILHYKFYKDKLMLDFAHYCNIQICKQNNKLNRSQSIKQNKSACTQKKYSYVGQLLSGMGSTLDSDSYAQCNSNSFLG